MRTPATGLRSRLAGQPAAPIFRWGPSSPVPFRAFKKNSDGVHRKKRGRCVENVEQRRDKARIAQHLSQPAQKTANAKNRQRIAAETTEKRVDRR
jgi:hypothetical protein